jgi:hypothetical protein
MFNDPVSLDYAITFLNELVEADPQALHQLIEFRAPCNGIMADHPTVQIVDHPMAVGEPCPYDGVQFKRVPGYEEGYGCPVCKGLSYHLLLEEDTVERAHVRRVGLLGILNGLFGTLPAGPKEGWGPIAAVFDDQGQLTGFNYTDDSSIKPVEQK